MATVKDIKKKVDKIFEGVGKVIIGQEEVVKQIVICILCNANALVEGYPGLAKTLTIKTLAGLMDLKFKRIQGTPDLMPSDITGTYVLEEVGGKRQFKFQQGPLFANLVLMDEINRATPKTQSALLEAMEEKQITIGNTTFQLDKPFFVLATQNPIEQEGTYPLPEAQRDRFLLKIKVDYPELKEELEIISKYTKATVPKFSSKIFSKTELMGLQRFVKDVPVSSKLQESVVKIIKATREKKDLIEYGASPRASIGLVLAAKARALIEGRAYVTEADIKAMAYPILRHRLILSFEAEKENLDVDAVIKKLL